MRFDDARVRRAAAAMRAATLEQRADCDVQRALIRAMKGQDDAMRTRMWRYAIGQISSAHTQGGTPP